MRILTIIAALMLALTPPAFAQSIDFGDDSSTWSNDGECDDPRFEGPGMTNTVLLDEDILSDATDCLTAYQAGRLTLRGNASPPASFLNLLGLKALAARLSPAFAPSDPRRLCSLEKREVDPRIHFALNCGAKSCPAIKVYSPDVLEEGLRGAAEAFCEEEAQPAYDDLLSGEPCIYITADSVFVGTRYKRVQCKTLSAPTKTVKDVEALISELAPDKPLRSISFGGNEPPVVNG